MKPRGSSRIAATKQTKQHTSGEVNLVVFDLSWRVLQTVILIIVTWPQRVCKRSGQVKASSVESAVQNLNLIS